ncbi:MAG: hypothetical protein LBB89_04910 [Treponema sp.]|jgi:hypothetical protein|nr:hypothetical protein [Treponema sp.]
MKKLILILLFFTAINLAFSQDIIQELIENDPEIKRLNNKINDLTNNLLNIINNKSNLDIFNAQIIFWMREKNNCRNQSGQNYRRLVLNSLRKTLNHRIQVLEQIIINQELIIIEASQYRFIDIWYLKMFSNDYAGKEIYLFGSLSMEQSEYMRGKITGYDETEIVVYFIPMSDNLFHIIHNQSIVSHFRGMVEIVNNEICFVIDQL